MLQAKKNTPATRAGAFEASINAMTAPAILLAPVIGGWLAQTGGYGWAFTVAGLCGVAALALLTFFVRDPRHRQRNRVSALAVRSTLMRMPSCTESDHIASAWFTISRGGRRNSGSSSCPNPPRRQLHGQ